jgi:L-asparagine transporter-like permease
MKEAPQQEKLHRRLGAGAMAMVAVGGSIGTGLLLGSGAAVSVAGPAIIFTYLIGAVVAFIVTMALGEVSARHPEAGSFGVAAEIYLGPWAGFVTRYGYWIAIVLSVGAEQVAAATYMHHWYPNMPGVVWIVLFSSGIVAVNLLSVGSLGSFETWFAMIKVVTIFAFILIGTVLLAGGRVAPQYQASGGWFPNGKAGMFLALAFALFSFLGIELLSASSGEAKDIGAIKRGTYIAFGLLAFVYIGATAVLVGVVPWNLVGVKESPFVTVFEFAHLHAASGAMNFVALTAALSGSVATLYICSRMLYSLSLSGFAPRKLQEVAPNGVPQMAVVVSAVGAVVGIVLQYKLPEGAYLYIIGTSLFGGMLGWAMTLAAHISMRRRMSPQEVRGLAFRAPGGAPASWVALLAITTIMISTWWLPRLRIAIVSGVPYMVVLSIAYFLAKGRTVHHGETEARS